jgi:hypothetical protein
MRVNVTESFASLLQVGEQAAGQIYIFVIQDERIRRNVAKSGKVFVVATVMFTSS